MNNKNCRLCKNYRDGYCKELELKPSYPEKGCDYFIGQNRLKKDTMQVLEACEDAISREEAIKAIYGYSINIEMSRGIEQYKTQITDMLQSVHEMQKKLIENLPPVHPKQRWIPVGERLPEYDEPVLLSTAWSKTEIGWWTQTGWMILQSSYREFEIEAVVAWMPLPEPYQAESEE